MNMISMGTTIVFDMERIGTMQKGTAAGGRTMGYPDFQMKEFDGYDAYDEIGISMNIAHSEILPVYQQKGLPMHFYCADTPEEVQFAVDHGASLITANELAPLLEILKK